MTGAPAPPPVQQFSDHLVNWLGRQGYQRPHRQVSYVDTIHAPGGLASHPTALADDKRIHWSKRYHEGLNYFASRLGRRGWLDSQHLDAARAALHEGLHRPQPNMTFTPQQLEWEEAATESAARDLMPAFLKQMYGHRFGAQYNTGSYGELTKNFRALSALGDPVNSRPARLRRRDFLNNPDQREALWKQWHAYHADNPR